MTDYIISYCEARGIVFGNIKDNQPGLLMCLPKHTAIEIDIMPVIGAVLQDEDLSKILISLNHNLCIWRLK